MGMRQIESMNNILNIIGKYNDYIVPVGPSGDYPIQFETMQGQNIETPNDIMEKMEEAAVNPVCPLELINSYMQQDFATRFSMSSTRFLKLIYARQRICEKMFSRIYTPVYNYEFNENFNVIEIQLPPPVFLLMSNAQQLFDQTSQTADKIIDSELSSEEDEVKSEFKKLYIHNTLSTYIDYDMVAKLLEEAKINVETRKQPAVNDGTNSDTYAGGEEEF